MSSLDQSPTTPSDSLKSKSSDKVIREPLPVPGNTWTSTKELGGRNTLDKMTGVEITKVSHLVNRPNSLNVYANVAGGGQVVFQVQGSKDAQAFLKTLNGIMNKPEKSAILFSDGTQISTENESAESRAKITAKFKDKRTILQITAEQVYAYEKPIKADIALINNPNGSHLSALFGPNLTTKNERNHEVRVAYSVTLDHGPTTRADSLKSKSSDKVIRDPLPVPGIIWNSTKELAGRNTLDKMMDVEITKVSHLVIGPNSLNVYANVAGRGEVVFQVQGSKDAQTFLQTLAGLKNKPEKSAIFFSDGTQISTENESAESKANITAMFNDKRTILQITAEQVYAYEKPIKADIALINNPNGSHLSALFGPNLTTRNERNHEVRVANSVTFRK